MKINCTYKSYIDSTPAMRAKLRAHVLECLQRFPTGGEGVIKLGGIVHFFTYMTRSDGVVELVVLPRDVAETVLNTDGLSTHEPWSPLPGSERPH